MPITYTNRKGTTYYWIDLFTVPNGPVDQLAQELVPTLDVDVMNGYHRHQAK